MTEIVNEIKHAGSLIMERAQKLKARYIIKCVQRKIPMPVLQRQCGICVRFILFPGLFGSVDSQLVAT